MSSDNLSNAMQVRDQLSCGNSLALPHKVLFTGFLQLIAVSIFETCLAVGNAAPAVERGLHTATHRVVQLVGLVPDGTLGLRVFVRTATLVEGVGVRCTEQCRLQNLHR